MDDKTFGIRLRELRQRRMLTQRELAEMIGADWHAVQRWEAGTRLPRPQNQRQLCTALQVTPEQLLGLNQEAPHGLSST